MTTAPKQRPKFYDLNLAHLPPPGLVSIFHRISGALLFLVGIPAILFLLQSTLGSEEGWRYWRDVLALPAVKVVFLGFAWLYAHHFFAGIRYLLLDVHVGVVKPEARATAIAVFVLGALATALVAWRIW